METITNREAHFHPGGKLSAVQEEKEEVEEEKTDEDEEKVEEEKDEEEKEKREKVSKKTTTLTKPSRFLSNPMPIVGLETKSATLCSIPLRPDSRGSPLSRSPSRQGSRKTISRSSSRRSRAGSAATKQTGDKGQSSDSDSDDYIHRDSKSDSVDIMTIDISDESAFDTDLEDKDPPKTYDHTGRTSYMEHCKQLGIIPASYFLRHMQDPSLNMTHHGLGKQGIKPIACALASNTHVLTLNLTDNWLGVEGGVAVFEMMKDNCFITELNLSDNRIGSKCAPALAHYLIQNDTLKKLTLAGNFLDDTAAPYLAELILQTKSLEVVDLSHNALGEKAGQILGPAVSDNSCIKELDLSWNHLRRKGAIALAQGIKTNVFMKKVNLSWNGFSLEGAIAMGDALKGNSVLEELDISNNRITTEGAVLIGKGLSQNETLQVLKIGKNPMESAGCYGICAAILRNPNCVVRELDFSDVTINRDFKELLPKVLEQIPGLKMTHGGTEPPLKPKARIHPMVKVSAYIRKHNLRLVDFFNKFDKDKSMSVTREEFVQGLERFRKETGINLTDEEIQWLIEELDKDGDGEINYSEMVIGHTDFEEQERKTNIILTTLRPTTA